MTSSLSFAQITGPVGASILRRFLEGDPAASSELLAIINAATRGDFDTDYASVPDDKVQVTTSCHLMVLAILNQLTGLNARDFYKADPLRYVRLNCLIQRMLGLERLTLGWPVYAFGAEALGQLMIYTEAQAPGSDPGEPLVNQDNWKDLPRYNPMDTVAKLVRETLRHMAQLGGIEPVAHLPAPYSLAAEIYGQEFLIIALTEQPELVAGLLDMIVERVLAPWCDDLVANIPNVWLEFSDASGSPMFIGPERFLEFAVKPMRKMIADNPWGDRVFVANYRGDLPAGAKTRGRRKRAASSSMSFEIMLEAKQQCCPNFLTRLEADAAEISRYSNAAIKLGMSLYIGMGAVRLDRNSVPDVPVAISEIRHDAAERTREILRVSNAGAARGALSWPGDIYIEDTNLHTHPDLFNAVLDGVKDGNEAG